MTPIQECASPKYRARIFLLPLVLGVFLKDFSVVQFTQGALLVYTI